MDNMRYNVELVLKLSSRPGSELSGEASFIFSDSHFRFSSAAELVNLIDAQASGTCPHLRHSFRTWTRGQPPDPEVSKGQDLPRETSLATFHISIQFAENCTWQGRIQWLEGRKTLHFRSFLELLRLVDEARRTAANPVSMSIGL